MANCKQRLTQPTNLSRCQFAKLQTPVAPISLPGGGGNSTQQFKFMWITGILNSLLETVCKEVY